MTYKETLFFIGKCLTISHEERNLDIVSRAIKTDTIDWGSVVKVSTSHYVFPALYCNLKRAGLLSYLPEGLVEYMKHITNLNRDRNLQIIEQAKEINELLISHGITPIFLKGAGNLLEGLYQDIAERMVGDIDFLIPKVSSKKTIKILIENGYNKGSNFENNVPDLRHFPRLTNEDHIAAIEIHTEMILKEYSHEFNYQTIEKNIIQNNNYTYLGYRDQLALSIIAKQINDYGQFYNNISLRNAYDAYLLSKKIDPIVAIKSFNKIFDSLNNFLALCEKVLSSEITYTKTKKTQKSLILFDKLISNSKFQKAHHKKWKRRVFFKNRFNIITKSFYRKDYRNWLLKRMKK
jgi:hypothetical protein